MKTPRPRSTEPGAALPDTMVVSSSRSRCALLARARRAGGRPPRAAGHVPRLRYAAAASLTSGSSPAEWICRSMRRMRRCRRRYQRAASRFRWWGRWLGGEGDPDGVVQPSPGTPSLPNSSTGSSSAWYRWACSAGTRALRGSPSTHRSRGWSWPSSAHRLRLSLLPALSVRGRLPTGPPPPAGGNGSTTQDRESISLPVALFPARGFSHKTHLSGARFRLDPRSRGDLESG